MRNFCECPDEGQGRNSHQPHKCKNIMNLREFKRYGKKITLCTDCMMPKDIEIHSIYNKK